MVLISGNKYACETCIKGHRSSTCKHTDRPLFEIKRKGRPVTQCDHCRELRKTKQIHVKCVCEVKEEPAVAPSCHSKKASHKQLGSATFPNGLPQSLETSATPSTEGVSSDSDHGSGCCCATGVQCPCWTPRKHAPRNRKKKKEELPVEIPTTPDIKLPSEIPIPEPSQTPAHIRARIAGLRPVLPRPPQQGVTAEGASHDLPHAHPNRYHGHDEHHFSPYGRAYDQNHPRSEPRRSVTDLEESHFVPVPVPVESSVQQDFATPSPPPPDWMLDNNLGEPFEVSNIPSFCSCGDSCGCPNCRLHKDTNGMSTSGFATCQNPTSCGMCLECAVLSVPPVSDNSGGEQLFDTRMPGIDEWLEQLVPSANEASGSSNYGEASFGMPQDWKINPVFEDIGDASTSYLPTLSVPSGPLEIPELGRSRSSSTSSQSSIVSSEGQSMMSAENWYSPYDGLNRSFSAPSFFPNNDPTGATDRQFTF